MTSNQAKYENWSRPLFWTKKRKTADNSIFQWKFDEDKQMYYTSKLGIYNGFIGLFGKVMYYIPEEDVFRTVRKFW
jgi:hypothetical protein